MAQGLIWVRRVAIAAIALGLVLRFAHLDRKVYWHDEAYTSLRVAGYVGPAVEKAATDRPDLTAAELLRYQQMPPEPSLANSWIALANNPEHPPLYYLLAHGWGRLFGASVAGYRAIAAIFGAIAIAVMFWLGRLLFPASPAIAWVAVALLAVAPLQLIYSQEAREYTLWAVGLLLAHGSLIRAMERGTTSAWIAYGLALGLAWYGSLMTVLLGLSHGAYVVLSQVGSRAWLKPDQKWPAPKAWMGFMLANGLGLGLFAPWLWVIVQQWGRLRAVTAWANEPRPLAYLAQFWGLHYSSMVVDFNAPLSHPFTLFGPALVLLVVGLGLRHIWHTQPRSLALFLSCGLLVPPLVLIGGDVVRGSQFSGTTRYFFPSLVLLPLAIAPLLVHWLTAPQKSFKALGATLLALLLTVGTASGVANNRALTWWNKTVGYSNIHVANYLNQVPKPTVLLGASGIAMGEALSLSHYLQPDTALWLLPQTTMPAPDSLQTVLEAQPQTTLFLLKPSPALLNTVPPGWQTAAIETGQFAPSDLVQLTPPPTS
ncbi:glycosyltransferase family 39 protein [Nodosilinea sp. LEGE 06152]|uniref:glycosyltransferase family 39 protein n=1 Tax=Nodosilinea sp. LEGE 06152 TaxID=2777966 RepID=UPI0018801D89|nr:glycosyltransferase family 39 protein [Nodosilinea sp. LEGE 06152]MBE9158106.1 glycosyltransferase family 39 protein [Nodosilinea sp. LEGE 06152]